MNDSDDIRKQLEAAAGKAAKQADEELQVQLRVLLKATRTELESLRPKVTDSATFDKLIGVVNEATQRKMDSANALSRVKALGSKAVALMKEVVGHLRPV